MKVVKLRYTDSRYKNLGIMEAVIYADNIEDAKNQLLSDELGSGHFITFYD